MSRHQSLLVCLTIIFLHNRLCTEAAARPGSSNQSRITNGEEVPEGKWPFMAAIVYVGEESNFCGGSVLNDDSILTAAHCLFWGDGEIAPPAKLTIYLGHVDLEGEKDEAYLFEVLRFFVHPKYYNDKIEDGYDLAVIKLARTIDFSALENVAPVCLPDYDTYPQWDQCIVMGWGDTEPGDHTTKLLQTDLSTQRDEVCWDISPAYDPETLLCAGNTEDGKGWCYTDGGGPLVCQVESSEEEEDDDEQPIYLQYGIVSHTFQDLCGKGPGFYTRVRTLGDWITQRAES